MIELKTLRTIRNWFENADAVVICTGSGMSVDSGLKTYRGSHGAWGEVELLTGQTIFEFLNPLTFINNPKLIWSYFGNLMIEFNGTKPHNGYSTLLKIIEKYNLDYFCLTTNIDNQLQIAGFKEEKIRELHGTLNYFQCIDTSINKNIWRNEITGKDILINITKDLFPTSPEDKQPARPNIYMFRDYTYLNTLSQEQEKLFRDFLRKNHGKEIIIIEIGVGIHVQSLRQKIRFLRKDVNAKILRINIHDFKTGPQDIGIALGAKDALDLIDNFLFDHHINS